MHDHQSSRRFSRRAYLYASLVGWASALRVFGQGESLTAERFRQWSEEAQSNGTAESFRGITTNGQIREGLFALRSTKVSTEPMRVAAQRFLSALDAAQRRRAVYPVDSSEWRKWMNTPHTRRSISFLEMNGKQRNAAFGILQASLSARGMQLTRDIMRLNETYAELAGNHEFFGEWHYYLTIFGRPSATEPWGWQFDGHHAIINCFVLGDQVVMTPYFAGSEPVHATSGKYKGTIILQEEQRRGFEMLRDLDEEQRTKAVLSFSKTGRNNLAEAFKDNIVLDYAGVRAATLRDAQRRRLIDAIDLFTGNMAEGHARVKMDEVRRHIDETAFAWIGGVEEDSVFYYRIHSPVILIEFDHQNAGVLRNSGEAPNKPTRKHIHVMVRTPNGNDYGKDLLRQHYIRHKHQG